MEERRAVTDRQTPPTAWKVLISLAILRFVAHLATNGNYGVFRDEFYYLACADHLSWGYVDHPPLSIAILAVWKAIFGDSAHAIRIIPALCGSVVVILAGLTARDLGGRSWAQSIAAVSTAIVPTYLAFSGFYSMNVFDLTFWTLAAYLLVRVINSGNEKLWLLLGVVLGLGLLNKLSVLVLGLGIATGLLLTSHRRNLRSSSLWLGAAIAGLIFLPHIIWQIVNGWPTLEFMANAKQYKIADVTFLGFLTTQVMQMQPVNVIVWISGLSFLLFAKRMAPFRILGLVYLIAFTVFVVQQSKPYYLAAAYVPLLAAGGCAIETAFHQRLKWGKAIVLGLVLITGLLTAPFGIPILPVETFISYQRALGVQPSNEERSEVAELPQIYADRFGWEEMTETVATVYESLTPAERTDCLIVCRNYGEAGAITYYGRHHGLPPAVSQHNSYFLWGPGEKSGNVVIAVGYSEEDLRASFESVNAAAQVRTQYSMPYERNLTVYVARGLTRPFKEAWAVGKLFI